MFRAPWQVKILLAPSARFCYTEENLFHPRFLSPFPWEVFMKLLFKQRFFSWLDSYDIFDETGCIVYTVKGRVSWGH